MQVYFTGQSKINPSEQLSTFSADDNGNQKKAEVNMPKQVFTGGIPPEKRLLYIRILIKIVLIILAIILIVIFGRTLFDIAMPFILAFLIAWIFNPLLKYLTDKFKVRRIITMIILLVTYAIIGAVIWNTGVEAIKEINNMIANLPTYLQQVISYLSNRIGENGSTTVFLASGKEININLETIINYLYNQSTTQLSALSSSILTWLGSIAFSIPNLIIFIITLIISSYFITAGYPQLAKNVNNYLGNEFVHERDRVVKIIKNSIVEYLQALLIIALIVTIINYIGFVILDVSYAVILALFMGFLDFLPILGSGGVLVPWAIVCFAIGDYSRGIGILVIYAVVFVAHRIMEPKIIGQTSGISPLLTLLGIYAGFIIGGFSGMIIGPFIMILFVNTIRAGILSNSFAELKIASYDLYCFLRGREIKS